MVGRIRLLILSVERLTRQPLIDRLLIAASLTSGSESYNSKVKVWIKLLSVISFPKDSANAEKFLAKANRTFQDLSSPAARRVPRVWI
jgi:hypothetical protein